MIITEEDRKMAFILLPISIILITIGIILQLIKTNCDNKTIQDYFESEICKNVGNS